MKKVLPMLLILLFSNLLHAQMQDDFSDGDFSNDPTWIGDETFFKVNSNHQLQLNGTDAGKVSLATEHKTITHTEWRFWIKMSFAPSANNFAQVYLAADKSDLKEALNGYYLHFGENGAADAIELYKQTGTSKSLICRARDSAIATAFAIRVKVTCSVDNDWKIFADMTGGVVFQEIASGHDVPFFESQYLGVYCQYTKTNALNFYFDDFYVGTTYADTIPPKLQAIDALSGTELLVTFDEIVTQESAQNVNNYIATPDNLIPQTAQLQSTQNAVLLTFAQPFVMRQEYTLTARNMTDVANNMALTLQVAFAWFTVLPGDVLINEIMAHPAPVVGLPDAAYVELYNNTPYALNLNGWSLIVGTSTKNFGDFVLNPHTYLILCHNNNKDILEQYGLCYGFSSFSLTYGGTSLVLYDNEKKQIDYVSYSDTWYGDDLKKNGGWSLERIDPDNGCNGAYNWTTSRAVEGGTPGTVNSVLSEHPETTYPKLVRADYISEQVISVVFNKAMNPANLINPQIWTADRGLGNPQSVTSQEPAYITATLTFSNIIEAQTTYTLTLQSDKVTDCSGMPMQRDGTASFARPFQPELFDIVINEVMFSPIGIQYVELYNRSEIAFDTKYLRFIYEDNKGVQHQCALPQFLLLPGTYVVLTKHADAILAAYTANEKAFLPITDLPSLSTSTGTVRIAKAADSTQVIDAMHYDNAMHSPMFNATTGVSLERISPNRHSGDMTNWHSAAETAGFGTPGLLNSQYNDGATEDEISIDPEVFTPNNDGTDDVLNIRYKFNESGYVANVYIFDAKGKLVRRLTNNATIGTEGTFSWDGKDDDNRLANAGIYVVLMEIFNLQGKTKRYKKTGTLGVTF